MEWYVALAVAFGALLLLMLTGLPIAFCLGVLGIVAILLFWPEGVDMIGIIATRVNLSFALIAMPLFIFMGEIIMFCGLGKDIFDIVEKWLGGVPGSLAAGSVAACTVFGAICGSATATTAAIGTVSIPEMLKRNYYRPLALGGVVMGGSLGILIPPSITMILYGTLGNQSVAALFIGGIIPGLVISALMMLYIVIQCTRNPHWAPRQTGVSWRERIVSLRRAWGVIFLISLVLGTMYLGVTTPTEAAAMGAFGAVILGFVYRAMNWKNLRGAFLSTVRLTSMIMFIMVGGILFSKILTIMGIAQQTIVFFTTAPVNRWVIMIGINILLLFLGCLMDSGSIIIVFTPLLVPLIVALGFDPIWFGVVFTINIGIGCVTPPVGYNLFVMKGLVPDAPMEEVVKGSVPFLALYTLGLALTMAFPQLALWLPAKMY